MKILATWFLAMVAFLASVPAYGEVITNIGIPIDFAVFIPCAAGGAGEVVVLSGDLHILISTTVDAKNKNVHLRTHFQPQGISGLGLTTGDKYQGTGVTRSDQNFDGVDFFPFIFTFVNNFRIIGQGPGNNFLVHENFHLTVNANGTVTAFVDNFSICK